MYAPPDSNLVSLVAGSIASAGGSQAHSNMQPYLTLNFCIALQGIFPSRN
jgi:microcystin-dependent protein